MVVTPAGRAAAEAAAPAHVDAVRAAVFDRLSPEQVQQLGEICDVLVEGLEPDARRAGTCRRERRPRGLSRHCPVRLTARSVTSP